jgi:hypothetical protein
MDIPIVEFLQKLQQNSLLANVNLWIHLNSFFENLRIFMGQLLPLIGSINSIKLYNRGRGELYGANNVRRNRECLQSANTLMAMATFLETRFAFVLIYN